MNSINRNISNTNLANIQRRISEKDASAIKNNQTIITLLEISLEYLKQYKDRAEDIAHFLKGKNKALQSFKDFYKDKTSKNLPKLDKNTQDWFYTVLRTRRFSYFGKPEDSQKTIDKIQFLYSELSKQKMDSNNFNETFTRATIPTTSVTDSTIDDSEKLFDAYKRAINNKVYYTQCPFADFYTKHNTLLAVHKIELLKLAAKEILTELDYPNNKELRNSIQSCNDVSNLYNRLIYNRLKEIYFDTKHQLTELFDGKDKNEQFEPFEQFLSYAMYSFSELKKLLEDNLESVTTMNVSNQNIPQQNTATTFFFCGTMESPEHDYLLSRTYLNTKGNNAHIFSGPGTKEVNGNSLPKIANGAITGDGWKKNIDNALGIIKSSKDITTINLVGWSRGAVSAIMLVNKILNDDTMEDRRNIKINLFLIDPVAGTGNNTDRDKFTLPEHLVDKVRIIYAEDERGFIFRPLIPKMTKMISTQAAGNTQSKKIETSYIRGTHSSLVDPFNTEISEGYLLLQNDLEQFLVGNGTLLHHQIELTDEQKKDYTLKLNDKFNKPEIKEKYHTAKYGPSDDARYRYKYSSKNNEYKTSRL